MNQTDVIALKDTTANPAPLGLFAFGMTTVLLNLHNAGIFEMNAMILAMGLFYGGLAQVVAGIMEAKKNNTFGLTAFVSYGFFWLTLVGLLVMPKLGWGEAASETGMVAYLVMWGIFTALLFLGTLQISRALQVVFATLTVLFFLLALGDATGNAAIKTFTGYEGIICGASAIYAATATLLNEVYGRTLLPVGAAVKPAAVAFAAAR
ncbi:acetate uptake transporter [Pontibacter liquoris]|uniref:acetate uptake transporter n=1 Tax=Pontibacter liquoris TaxID=2905677 RepID=UPI001FA7B95D|nr:acetate uptake transporter [Pontibacter liquoris]